MDDQMPKVLEQLDRLKEFVDFSTEDVKCVYTSFDSIYKVKTFRHSYSEISKYLSDLIPDERDIIELNLLEVLFYAAGVNENSDTTVRLGKLSDHVSLEHMRLGRMDAIKFIGTKVHEESQEMKRLSESNNKNMGKLHRRINGFQSQSITILGIFSGLVIGFSSGIDLLDSTFSNINSMNFYKMLVYICVIGLILFDVIFMLMYSVSKISNGSLAVACKNESCDSCGNCKLKLSRLRHKYPYVYWFNALFILLTIALIIYMFNNNIV